jgi:hypothetical protein
MIASLREEAVEIEVNDRPDVIDDVVVIEVVLLERVLGVCMVETRTMKLGDES